MIPIQIMSQPNDVTCGPTSLHAVYRYYQDPISLNQTIKEVTSLEDGGTLAVCLGCHALRRGYRATIYTYNLSIFDPQWFLGSQVDMIQKLKEQMAFKKQRKLKMASKIYISFLKQGGCIRFVNLDVALMKKYFKKDVPVLTGLSATYLYQCSREIMTETGRSEYHDIQGVPSGHFVVLCGYDSETKHILVADPYGGNPVSKDHVYHMPAQRLLNAILLGAFTYDANLLIIEK